MKNLMDAYSHAVGFKDEMFMSSYIGEFKNFVFDFLEDSYPGLPILNWLEENDEMIRVDILSYEPNTNEIWIKIKRFSDYSYFEISISPKVMLEFNVEKSVDSIFCIISKNNELLLEHFNNFA